MLCTKCGKKLKTVYTACDDENNETLREKCCLYCGHRIYTIEFEAEPTASKHMWAIANKKRRRKCES